MSTPAQGPFRMDDISEARLLDVIPALANRVRQLAQILDGEGFVIRVVQGLRTWKQQDDLYAQGRTAPGKIVTNAKGGYSWHNFGMAVDCVPSVNGVEQAYLPDWNPSHPAWQRMVNVAIGLGLDSGATWSSLKDYPHLQITGRFRENAPDDEVRQIFKDAGMEGVWSEAEIV